MLRWQVVANIPTRTLRRVARMARPPDAQQFPQDVPALKAESDSTAVFGVNAPKTNRCLIVRQPSCLVPVRFAPGLVASLGSAFV
jgi:hypothetical protein